MLKPQREASLHPALTRASLTAREASSLLTCWWMPPLPAHLAQQLRSAATALWPRTTRYLVVIACWPPAESRSAQRARRPRLAVRLERHQVDELTVLAPGDEITRATDPAARGIIVGERRMSDGSVQYEVAWTADGRRSWMEARRLVRMEPYAFGWTTAADFLCDLALLKFFHEFSDVLFSIGASRTEFLVYQFKPVLQFIQQSPHGLLIADEVGLGKTVEAALILRELLARGQVERLLVVCPANLRRKWQGELRQRFGIELREMRSRDFRELADRFAREGRWPRFSAVTSLEGLRQTDFEQTLQETGVNLDLVIVDEAHHLRNPETRSFALGETLSDLSDHIILLSATPIQTGRSDLLSLLQLVDPAEFRTASLPDLDALLEPNRYINGGLARLSRPEPDLATVAAELRKVLDTAHGAGYENDGLFVSWLRRLDQERTLSPESTVSLRRELRRLHTLAPYYTRTRKREVEAAAERRAHVVRVRLSGAEQEFYDAWVRFLRARARALQPGLAPGFSIIQRERQAASSLQAARAKLADLIANTPIGADFEGSDPDSADDDGDGGSRQRLARAAEEVREAAKRLPEHDSKVEQFDELIRELLERRPGRNILVFTFFRDTLRLLRQHLQESGIGCASIWGDDSPEQRADIVDDFRADPDRHVLLSTEVGSEGLDFQFCDVVVNYDLPWNPMRVEQRIGRIDRFGQLEPQVIVASFFVEESIDTRVLLRLYERIRVFEESIGELEPILGPEISELQADVFTRDLTAAEEERRVWETALRIEQKKLDIEAFESARAELMGQGDLLYQEVEATHTSGRYVSSAEVQAVLRRWLHRGDGRGALRTTRRAQVFDLRMSEMVVSRVYRWMNENRVNHPDAERLLQRIQTERHAWVTFDSAIGREYEGLPFLHIGHPVVATAIEELSREETPGWIARIGSFARSPGREEPALPVDTALAIYRVSLRGLERQELLLPVAVEPEALDVLDDFGDVALGAVAQAEAAPPPVWLDEDAARLVEMEAFEHADRKRRDIEQLAREQQADRIAVQRATLERTYRARIERKLEIRGRVEDERIKRLYAGQATNLEAELTQRIEELSRAPEPSAELELLSMAVFAAPPEAPEGGD